MTPEWQARIDDEQEYTHEEIAGKSYPRVRYGTEMANLPSQCRDCACTIGELHVHGCCVERCARCGGQAISCTCGAERRLRVVH